MFEIWNTNKGKVYDMTSHISASKSILAIWNQKSLEAKPTFMVWNQNATTKPVSPLWANMCLWFEIISPRELNKPVAWNHVYAIKSVFKKHYTFEMPTQMSNHDFWLLVESSILDTCWAHLSIMLPSGNSKCDTLFLRLVWEILTFWLLRIACPAVIGLLHSSPDVWGISSCPFHFAGCNITRTNGNPNMQLPHALYCFN